MIGNQLANVIVNSDPADQTTFGVAIDQMLIDLRFELECVCHADCSM